ncbi:MAG: hypothetical protein ACR2LL_06480 [Nitrosopumilus sp.]
MMRTKEYGYVDPIKMDLNELRDAIQKALTYNDGPSLVEIISDPDLV